LKRIQQIISEEGIDPAEMGKKKSSDLSLADWILFSPSAFRLSLVAIFFVLLGACFLLGRINTIMAWVSFGMFLIAAYRLYRYWQMPRDYALYKLME
jgi:uncharacterized membrane protein YphA (DoxX/SURF4 family)